MQTQARIILTLMTVGLASPGLGQRKQAPERQVAAMAAMHCGGDMAGMMPGMAGGQPGMRGMPADTAMQRMMPDMMGPPSPAMILRHKDQLGLSTEQLTRLATLQEEGETACTAHMRLAMAAHRSANRLLDAQAPDFSAYTAKLREASGHMVEAMVATAKAAVGARDVLTTEQRDALKRAMEEMHRRP